MPASARLDNVLRYHRGMTAGHVESYFWRANDPNSRRAFWLKATILARRGRQPATADIWCSTFDGVNGIIWGDRQTLAFDDTRFEGAPLEIEIGDNRLLLDPDSGRASGSLTNSRGSCSWDITWAPTAGSISKALSIFPFRWMLHTSIPRSKTVTPHPVLEFNGEMKWSGRSVSIDGWSGMQGHNWGVEHTPRYAWGQCIFFDGQRPTCMVEGFSGRIRVGGKLTPPISALVIRHQGEEYRFNKLLDLWNQETDVTYPTWTLSMKSKVASATLTMVANPDEMICLGYLNPNGALNYCLNSKLAETRLQLTPKNGKKTEFYSHFGGALEFLTPENPGFENII
ncbi:MAG: hypothetical protein VYA30_16045 [Myxococcota bacterium]|nr:hypothetical protein [Myxococcota bacterium]